MGAGKTTLVRIAIYLEMVVIWVDSFPYLVPRQ